MDEIQKIPGWSDIVKRLWDEDSAAQLKFHVLLLGSSPLLVQKGLGESLAGRFEITNIPHWSFTEMNRAFGWDMAKYLYFGGYPGAVELISNEQRWKKYIHDTLIETTVARDILLMNRIDKPALLRQLFELGCRFSGQILSYQKMVGQLQEAGNTTTLAHYLELLYGAGLIAGIPKYSGSALRRRKSSPKLLVLNTALMSANTSYSFQQAKLNIEYWGRLTETAVGAHLINSTFSA
jgi:predicted AAA+ superfamily ATPase